MQANSVPHLDRVVETVLQRARAERARQKLPALELRPPLLPNVPHGRQCSGPRLSGQPQRARLSRGVVPICSVDRRSDSVLAVWV